MKIISLNIWGGRVHEPLMDFVKRHRESTDVFCFQEIMTSPRKDIETSNENRIHILEELAAILPDFRCTYHIDEEGMDSKGPVDFELQSGGAVFLKKNIPIVSSGTVALFTEILVRELPYPKIFKPKNFGYVRIPWKETGMTIANIHAFTYRGDDKLDMPERIEQSKKIKEFVDNEKGSIVLCGDFNLLPDTESIRMLENPLINLIKKYEIKTTRSTLSPWYGTENQLNFADYAFVSPDLEVTHFEVPDEKVSDHLPLIAEFR
jgi:endonuclease/exonuclease/phosphatase family metal-dependent hydrolase